MTQYADHAHPENARYTGETPRTQIDIGPAGISVSLDAWGPQENLFTTLYDTSCATWGESPKRSALQPCSWHIGQTIIPGRDRMATEEIAHLNSWEHKTGWCRLEDWQRKLVEGAFAGKSLQQDLEGINLWFTIDGVSRAFTHEFVRTRLGAAFKQHGGRDNDWRHRHWTMTEAMERACVEDERDAEGEDNGKRHAILDWEPINEYLVNDPPDRSLRNAITDHLDNAKRLYAALVDAGIAWQDARRVLPIGCQTYVHGIYNYVGFRGAAANRLEFIMDWEINCVFQLMLREIKMKCPPLLSAYLGSHSDIAGKAMFDRLELCPPDGKYPSTTIVCGVCWHAEANHHARESENVMPGVTRAPQSGEQTCEVCERDGDRAIRHHIFQPHDTLPRVFRREQQPFFVLHPDSMNGGPVQWLWTNGSYQDIQSQLSQEQK